MNQLMKLLQCLYLKSKIELTSLLCSPAPCAVCQRKPEGNFQVHLLQREQFSVSWPLLRLCPSCLGNISATQIGSLTLENYSPLFTKSFGIYSGNLRALIHSFKYHNKKALAYDFALLLASLLEQDELLEKPLLIPVPLHKSKLQERGFNQAGELARLIGIVRGVDFCDRALLRVQKTKSQYGLTKKERLNNVQAAFLADSARVSGRSIILVDDIVTTGATACACREALATAGAKEIKLLTLAQALLRHTCDRA
jgi:ComF family protein